MAIEKIDPEICIGCGTCIQCCPTDVIRMNKKEGKAFIAYPEDCQLCHICENLCPAKGAIILSSHKCAKPIVGWR